MIEDKIRKLLAMAEHANTNPHEAANAAARAAQLAADHNVDLQELRKTGQAPAKIFKGKLGPSKIKLVDMNAAGMILTSVGRLYVAVPLFYNYRDPPLRYSFKGQDHNVDLAISWTEYLWSSCKKANTEFTRAQGFGSSKVRETARQSFRLHFAIAVANRLTEKYREMTKPPTESDSRALAVVNYMVQEYKEIEETMGEVTQITGKEAKFLRSAALAGQEAGRRVSLNDQVSGTSSPSREQLARG